MGVKNDAGKGIWELAIQTLDGAFVAHYSERGLCRLNFPAKQGQKAPLHNGPQFPAKVRRWHEETSHALHQALAAQPIQALPPLDLSCGTDFQQRVWQALKRIGCGETLSYGAVAEEIGNRKAVRAVGQACGANPIPVLIPCHRVLASNQKLGGFSGGLDWKRKLLGRERVLLIE